MSSGEIGSDEYFKGRILLLVNEWTESYSEYLIMALQKNPKSLTVGYSTSGADGNITTLDFPGGVRTIYSGIGIYYPDGKETQRVGIVPNIWVEPTIDGIKNGKDEVLEKAIELIEQQ